MNESQREELARILAEVRGLELRSRRFIHDVVTGGYESAFRGAGMEFDEVREYVEGDDPRSIDWNVTARTGNPHVKKFLEEREQTILLVVDLSRSMSGGAGAWSARGAASRICALLGMMAHDAGDRVGLVAFDDGVLRFVPARKGMPHLLRILRDTVTLPSRSRRSSVAAALDLVRRIVRRRSVVFLISDFLHDDGPDDIIRCARHHAVVAMRVGSDAGRRRVAYPLRVVDPESSVRRIVLDGEPDSSAEARSRRHEFDEALRRGGVDVLDVDIPVEGDASALVPVLNGYFRRRARRSLG